MKTILHQISKLAIQLNKTTFTDEQIKSNWLGTTAASNAAILAAESRLGIELPKDYKRFLSITNGFFTPSDATEPTFEMIDKINYLKYVDAFLLEVWNKGILANVGEQLNRAIVIGGLNDEQYFLLIPPKGANSKWQYWKFANWIPGEEPYLNLESYFTSVLEHMKDI